MWSRHFWQFHGSSKSGDDSRFMPGVCVAASSVGTDTRGRAASISSGVFSYPGKNVGFTCRAVSRMTSAARFTVVAMASAIAALVSAGRMVCTGPSRCRLHGRPSFVHNLQGLILVFTRGGRHRAHSVYIDVAGISSPHFVQAFVFGFVPAGAGVLWLVVLQSAQNLARAILRPSATNVLPQPAQVFVTRATGRSVAGLRTAGRTAWGGVRLNRDIIDDGCRCDRFPGRHDRGHLVVDVDRGAAVGFDFDCDFHSVPPFCSRNLSE